MPPDRPRRTTADRLAGPLLGMLFVRAEVAGLGQVTPQMRLIRLGGSGLRGLGWTPGQQVRVRVRDPRGRAALRTYSVWSYQGDEIDLCVLDHGDGPGAGWARSLRKGDEGLLRKPEGTFVAVESAPYHLFAGRRPPRWRSARCSVRCPPGSPPTAPSRLSARTTASRCREQPN
jgi:hypothetical protein